MKIICDFKVGGFILVAAFSAGLGFATGTSAQEHSYLIDLNSKTVTDIGTLGGTYTYASGINGAGQVVGVSNTAGDATYHAFITGPDGMGMRDLGTLGGTYSFANGINAAGQVVGAYDVGGGQYAFITGPDGMGMRSLGSLAGLATIASGINGAGQVVGYSYTGGVEHAFITGPDGMGMRDLGTLGGTNRSEALGINDAGQVVGLSYSDSYAAGVHAFITGPNGAGMMDLNSLVDVPGRVVLERSTGINNEGQVVAIGQVPVIPEPEVYALFLAGLALVGFIARRKKMGGEAFSLG